MTTAAACTTMPPDDENSPILQHEDRKITRDGKEYQARAVSTLEKVFHHDPVIVYMLCSLTEAERIAYMPRFFDILFACAALDGGIFQEINDWSACAVWMPPRRRVDAWINFIPSGLYTVLFKLGLRGVKRMLFDYQQPVNEAKTKALKGRKDFFYLFNIGTREDQRKKGLASSLIREYQEIAQNHENGPLPIWLEATTASSMLLYKGLGFEVVKELVMGKGNAAADGRKRRGGEGVSVWLMLWDPIINHEAEKLPRSLKSVK